MQSILEKAEREGAVMRLRPQPEPASAVVPAAPMDVAVAAAPAAAGRAPAIGVPATTAAAPVVRTSGAFRLNRALVAAVSGDNVVAEQYRTLCTRIAHADQAGSIHAILVTSPGTGEGKSITAANLALTMAREYQRPVCVVDANLRAPRLHHLFGLPEGPGLADVLAGRAPLEEALTMIENLGVTVLQAGTPTEHPAELLGSSLMRQTLDSLRLQFDRIIVDTPAALARADMGLLTPLVDRIVLVVRAGVTAKASVSDVVTTLDTSRLLGVVLNEAA
jgi:receptor protein-tyrosine kinase